MTMATWWPWRRSGRPQPFSPAPAAPPAAWRALPALQRTVDDAEPTAAFTDFSASLTLAHNPALIGTVDTLSIDHTGTLPILGAGRPPTPDTTKPVAPQPRSWRNTPDLPQRILPAPVGVQLSAEAPADPAPPSEHVVTVPVAEVESAPMTSSPDPVDRREVPVVAEIPAARVDAPPTATDVGPATDPTPVAAEHVSRSIPPIVTPRTPPVQRAVEQTAEPAPETRAAAPPRSRVVDTPAPPPVAPTPVAQRVVETPRPVPPAPASTPVDAASPIDEAPPEVAQRASIPSVPSLSTPAPDDPVVPPTRAAAAPTAPPSPAPVQRTPSVSATPLRTAPVIPPQVSPPIPVQRVAETASREPTGPAAPPDTPVIPQPAGDDSGPRVHELRPDPPTRPVQRVSTNQLFSAAGPARPTPPPPPSLRIPAPSTPVPVPVQRSAPPTRESPAPPIRESPVRDRPTPAPPHPVTELTADRAAPPVDDAPLLAPVVAAPVPAVQPATEQPAPLRGRLVVLPPLRPPTPDSPGAVAPPAPEIAYANTTTMSLQRMFEHTTAMPPREPAPVASHHAQPSTVVTQHAGYTEVTWPQPTVQRDPQSPGPDPEPAADHPAEPPAEQPPEPPASQSVPATPPITAAPPPATAAGGNIDDLVQRLYDPLAARLRAELWQDRERAGVLMDLRR